MEGINYHVQLKALMLSMYKHKDMVIVLDINVGRVEFKGISHIHDSRLSEIVAN